jgi:creatinine amidohydrolase
MTATLPPRDWTDIVRTDVSPSAAERWIAVLPLAATEQHGPHLPVGTDVMIAQAYLARVRELLADTIPATFLPLQPVGISTEHVNYPGTLTLPTDVALKTWMALGESVARAGIKKLVMVTSHGGNSAAMTLVAQDHAGAPQAACSYRQNRGFSSRKHRHGKRLPLAFSASAGAVRLAGAGPS